MKKHLSFLLLCLAPLFFLWNLGEFLFYSHTNHKLKKHPPLTVSRLYEMEYQVSKYRPFVILVPSYNNEKYFRANLTSIFDQEYDNFRVIYIDDASIDRTKEGVLSWIEKEKRKDRFTLIANQKRQGALENFYRAFELCNEEEIIVFLDGDDALAHPKVLTYLNMVYEDPRVWMTYGSYIESPSYQKNPDGVIKADIHEKGSYRIAPEKGFLASHLRTGYAGIFKQIKLKDVLDDNGCFFSSSSDRALMWPALEMARFHARHIRDVLYIYNRNNPINDDKVDLSMQIAVREKIRKLAPYAPLDSWNLPSSSVDIIFESPANFLENWTSLVTRPLFKGANALWIVEPDELKAAFLLSQRALVFSPYQMSFHVVKTKEELLSKTKADYLFYLPSGSFLNESIPIKSYARFCSAKGISSLYFHKGNPSIYYEIGEMRQEETPRLIKRKEEGNKMAITVFQPWVQIQTRL